MKARDILVKPISRQDADRIVKEIHYSGKVVPNSQLHFGVFIGDRCGGAMQFGPSMDKRKMLGLVRDTKWNGFLELNRMAFAEWLPRNSESRAIGVALRTIRKNYPHIDWVVSFSDATQCGDGIIYRASGFVLTGINKNKTILRMPDGNIVADKTLNNSNFKIKGEGAGYWKKNGAKPLDGFQLRYMYFLNPEARSRLTVKELPFSAIDEYGARMYKGKRVESADSGTSGIQPEGGGAIPTSTLQANGEI